MSSDSTEQKESFAAQVEYYTGLIGGNPFWTLADIYADEGVTGTSMRKRDDFNRMIADCRRGKIDRAGKNRQDYYKISVKICEKHSGMSGYGQETLKDRRQRSVRERTDRHIKNVE